MNQTHCEYINYKDTGYFSKLIIDYIHQEEKIRPFYEHDISIDGINKAIEQRKKFATHRNILVEQLRKQYQAIELNDLQKKNIESLLHENTFTICTAHQPNIFTGPLYFIYKIVHAIKLADELNKLVPENHFVPVFYMGSEDADKDELGHITVSGEKLTWNTTQKGAVGRMKVDKNLLLLIDRLAGELGVLPFGNDLIAMFRKAYSEGTSIQEATLYMVNELFKEFGLLVIIPDNADLKRLFNPVIKKELQEQFSHPLVKLTNEKLGTDYKVQAVGRDLNLFYLLNEHRERIEKSGDAYFVKALGLSWLNEEMLGEVETHPDRFSANVILRPLFQEAILPNVVFIGGAGEIAYWLELKKVFEAVDIPYPMLLLRNSFLQITNQQKTKVENMGFVTADFFKEEKTLQDILTISSTKNQIDISKEMDELQAWYNKMAVLAEKVDVTLKDHTHALKTKAIEKIGGLQKKMLRKEKKKISEDIHRLHLLKQDLFPNNSLQERVENFSFFYAKYGKDWLKNLYATSLTIEQHFALSFIEE